MGLKSRTGRGKTDDRSFAERTEEKRELRTASGRVWRLAAVFLLACTVFMAGLSFVRSHAAFVEPAPAGPGEKVVIVEAGDSLWKIAVSVKKQEADPRAAVQAIMKRNGLSRPEIRSGQRLIIPESILR